MEWENKERQRLDDWYASTLKFLVNIKDYGKVFITMDLEAIPVVRN